MKEYFQKLFAFNQWANDLVVSFLEEKQIDDEKIVRILGHIMLAQETWYNRAISRQSNGTVWSIFPLSEIIARLKQNDEVWIDLVKSMGEGDFNKNLSYQNLAGQPQISTFQDVFAHVTNHATYHRGQVIYLIRDSGIAPPSTDYIKFSRM